MSRLFAVLKILVGCTLIVGGIILEGLWLAFCFGTIVVGILVLLFLPHVLLAPFVLFAMPGWQLVVGGAGELNPLNVRKAAAKIAPILRPQIDEIESSGDLSVPFNAQMLAYIGAQMRVSGRRASFSLLDVINVASTFFPDPRYKNLVQHLHHCVDYRDNLKGFWESVQQMVPAARHEWATGKGRALVSIAQQDRRPRQATALTEFEELDVPF